MNFTFALLRNSEVLQFRNMFCDWKVGGRGVVADFANDKVVEGKALALVEKKVVVKVVVD